MDLATDVNVQAALKMIFLHGPSRVLIRAGGGYEGVPSQRAREQYNITPDVVFIRRDGWSLGAEAKDAPEAYVLWRDEWVAFVVRPETDPRPIAEWRN